MSAGRTRAATCGKAGARASRGEGRSCPGPPREASPPRRFPGRTETLGEGPFPIHQLLPLLLAPIVGSFLGVLIRRLPHGRPVAWARSRCESCGARLGWRDLVPVASYLGLRGRCRHCGAPIGRFHLAVELAAIAVAAWAVLATDGPREALAAAGLGWALLALAWIDAAHLRLPDVLTLPLVVAGLAATTLLAPWALPEHAAGAAAGYLAFRLFAAAYRRWRGRDGLGGGDAKLIAAAGAWVGLGALPMVVFVAAASGIAFAVARQAGGAALHRHAVVPFGPFLAAGTWLVHLHRDLLVP